jgi:crossover junction endodeoxyribonuclease RuvC
LSLQRVFGLDPGLGRTGWAVVEREGSRVACVAYGLVATKPGPVGARLAAVGDGVAAALDEHRPELAAAERLFFTKNQTTALDVAKAYGAALVALARRGLEAEEFTPSEVKLAITGTGAATKEQVGFMVCRLLGLAEPPRPDDVADALAVALCRALRRP